MEIARRMTLEKPQTGHPATRKVETEVAHVHSVDGFFVGSGAFAPLGGKGSVRGARASLAVSRPGQPASISGGEGTMGGAQSARADGSGISEAVLRFLGGVPGEEGPDVEVL